MLRRKPSEWLPYATTRAIAYRVPVEVCAAWTIVELSLKEHAAISSRILAVRLTCGALAPWKSHTFVPRRAQCRYCSPFFVCGVQRRAGLPRSNDPIG